MADPVQGSAASDERADPATLPEAGATRDTNTTAATCPECGGHNDLPHDDIRAIMLALNISDHARPYSTHAVVHREILPAIRRLRGI